MNNEKIKFGLVCMISMMLMPVFASANIVWPSLYIATGMISWYVIVCGLIIEMLAVKYFLKETYLKSALIAFVMNLVSTILGIILIPLSGLIIEILMYPFGTPTFHPVNWTLSYIFSILINVLIEGLTVKLIFKRKFKKMFWWLFAANAASIIICVLFHGITMDNINL